MKKQITALLLLFVMLLSVIFAGCKETVVETTDNDGTTDPITDTEQQTEAETTEEIIVDEEPVFYEKQERDPIDPGSVDASGADWASSVSYANAIADGVQGRFTDAKRRKFYIENKNASLLYDLSTEGAIGVAAICNADGKAYFENTSDVKIILDDGKVYSSAESLNNGRMNSHRLGYYYYDFRFCDQMFVASGAKTQMAENESCYDIIANSSNWRTHDTTKVVREDGVLSYTVKDSYDPYVMGEVRFNTNEYDAIQITLKTETAQSGNFYIIAGAQTGYNADQNVGFRFNSGEWVTFVVPLSAIPDYTGYVTGFRIDIGEANGEIIEIKELKAIKRGDSSNPFQLERVFHTYSDKMHEVVRIVAASEYEDGGRVESQIFIPASTVRKFVLKNKDGEVSDLNGFDFETTEYIGFDIKGAGVFGIIMPALEDNGYVRVELIDGSYVITRGKEINGKIKIKGDVYYGHRIYTTTSHQFNDLRKEAYIERNPLTDVYITKSENGSKYVGYNALVGCYRFTINGSDFNKAYYREQGKHYKLNTLISGDGVVDRTIYVQSAEPGGMLECAAIIDQNELMLPIPLEVGKNFKGEIEEPLYDPNDTAYGEVYLPLTIAKDEVKSYTMLHLYQNWGNFPLKQLSFIAFHICYYHLSVGVTETNCIAPYFVYGKDGWTLPDFRANSAPLWQGQPQHTSAGRLYFLQYKDSDGNSYRSESQSADIASYGPVYADINMEYLSDDGKIKATYRHTEMPQKDENRTYYNIKLEVLEDVSIKDFKNDFSFFTFDGRSVAYKKVGYLNENNELVTENVKKGERTVKLGKEYPYYDYYGGSETDSVNFALIVINSDLTVGGKKYDGNFVLRDVCDGTLNYGSLSLDLDEITLKKGDVMEMQIILLPWGYSTSKNDDNVRGVREDSCIDPYKITVISGEAVKDVFIPSVKAVNNEAAFKISGGKNYAAVRVYGFEKYTLPEITAKADGADIEFSLCSDHGYDGYSVFLDEDGTYSFAFVVNMDSADEYELTLKQ
ncbi:MAG: hypothetical protein IJT49_04815 [Clostridia bacterium]|nr:hypothetical protein [Clostridia bacterium]